MKDSLNDLFRDRFQGHESPVDPAMWQVIEAHLLTAAPVADPVNDLLRDRFAKHEVTIDPGVWQNIGSQLGHGASASAGFGAFGWAAAGIAALVVAGGVYFAQLESTTPVQPTTTALIEPEKTIQDPVLVEHAAGVAAHAVNIAVPAPVHTTTYTAGSPIEPVVTTTPTTNNVESAVLPTTGQTTEVASVPANDTNLVNEIIAEMTEKVEHEVRAHSQTSTPPSSAFDQGAEMDATHEPTETRALKLLLPNTFTPNGDGVNDTYKVAAGATITSAVIRVYSVNTNQLVFSSSVTGGNGQGEIDLWDGANVEDGYFVVAVEAMTMDGRALSEGKVVWLNRKGMN